MVAMTSPRAAAAGGRPGGGPQGASPMRQSPSGHQVPATPGKERRLSRQRRNTAADATPSMEHRLVYEAAASPRLQYRPPAPPGASAVFEVAASPRLQARPLAPVAVGYPEAAASPVLR